MHQFSDVLGYHFKDVMLLQEALTHPSVSYQQRVDRKKIFNYERLEFLGDSVLGLVIAELLLRRYPDAKEGELAKRQSALVRGEALVVIAEEIGIGNYIEMTSGEEAMGGRKNPSNMENAMEALIGAIYLDGGFEEASKVIKNHWGTLIVEMKEPPRDSKTALQEWAQKRGFAIPNYEVINMAGPSHAPEFTIELSVGGFEPVRATGKSKKMAEKDAASLMLAHIHAEEGTS